LPTFVELKNFEQVQITRQIFAEGSDGARSLVKPPNQCIANQIKSEDDDEDEDENDSPRVDSRQNVTEGWSRQDFVAS
jgi:hypothetical protein